jgi:hypothetical protein
LAEKDAFTRAMGYGAAEEYDDKQLDMNVIGTSGLRRSGGVIDEEFHPKLRGRLGMQVYREMADNSSTIGAIRNAIKTLLRQVEWRVEPAEQTPEAEKVAEFVEQCMDDTSHTFEDFFCEALSMCDYGWAYFETCYKLRKGDVGDDPNTKSKFDDGRIGWRKFELRSQDSLLNWDFSPDDGGLRGMIQMDVYQARAPKFIPIEKALLFRTETTKNNPEGRSLYRNAVRDWFLLKRIEEIEAVGIERDMTGLLTMEVPLQLLQSNAGTAEQALLSQLKTMLGALKRDEREYAVVPQELDREGKPTGFKLKLLSSGGRRQIDTVAVKNYYVTNILKSVMAQFLQLGVQSETGSFALASSATSLFATALAYILDSFASVFNQYAIKRLMIWNKIPTELHPKLVHGDIESPDLKTISEFISNLSTAGALQPNPELEGALLAMANLPKPPEPEEVDGAGGIDPALAAAAAGGNIQDPALAAALGQQVMMNGAQIQSLVQVLTSAADGSLPRDSALTVISSVFPLTPAQAEKMLGSIGNGFVPMKHQLAAQQNEALGAKSPADLAGAPKVPPKAAV